MLNLIRLTDNLRREVVAPKGWVDLGIHPSVSAYIPSGRLIRSLTEFGGDVLVGYGDWSLNGGPVSVLAYDVATGEHKELLAGCPTEAFSRVVSINGAAYLPFVDPTGPDVGGFATNSSGVWENVLMPEYSMIHCFDVSIIGGITYVCGSSRVSSVETGASVWKRDPVLGWQMDLYYPTEGAGRFYDFFGKGRNQVRIESLTWTLVDGVWIGPTFGDALPFSATYDIGAQPRPRWTPPPDTTAYTATDNWAWIGRSDGTVLRAPLN